MLCAEHRYGDASAPEAVAPVHASSLAGIDCRASFRGAERCERYAALMRWADRSQQLLLSENGGSMCLKDAVVFVQG
jgi:hypothetical protein